MIINGKEVKEFHISYIPDDPFSKWLMRKMLEDARILFNNNFVFVNQLDVGRVRILSYKVL